MTEVLPAIREPDTLDRSLASVDAAVRFAEIIAPTHFVPGGLRGKPDQILACIMLGRELGLGPMRSLSWIVIVDGRPTLYAEGLRALILARGHEIRTVDWTKTRCVLAGRRAGSNEWQEVAFTMDDAKTAGLAGKPSWRQYPQDMLLARATSRLGRLMFADVLAGVETAEDYADTNGSASTASPSQLDAADEGESSSKQTRRRRRSPATPPTAEAPASDASTIPDAEVDDTVEASRLDSLLDEVREAEGQDRERQLIADLEASGATLVDEARENAGAVETITDEQRKKLHALFTEKDVTTRESRLAYCTRVAGREIESSNDLTVAEASRVIDVLDRWDRESGADPFAGLGDAPKKPYDPTTSEIPY